MKKRNKARSGRRPSGAGNRNDSFMSGFARKRNGYKGGGFSDYNDYTDRNSNEGRGWYGDHEQHSLAAKKGWRQRGYGDNYSRGNERREGHRGWFGDHERHSEAAHRAWENREVSRGNNHSGDHRGRGWYGDHDGHSEAARRGWRSRESDVDDYYLEEDDHGRGWFGDHDGHSEAARRGWRSRRSHHDDYDDRERAWYNDYEGHSRAALGNRMRFNDHDNHRHGESRRFGTNGGQSRNVRRGWSDDGYNGRNGNR